MWTDVLENLIKKNCSNKITGWILWQNKPHEMQGNVWDSFMQNLHSDCVKFRTRCVIWYRTLKSTFLKLATPVAREFSFVSHVRLLNLCKTKLSLYQFLIFWLIFSRLTRSITSDGWMSGAVDMPMWMWNRFCKGWHLCTSITPVLTCKLSISDLFSFFLTF